MILVEHLFNLVICEELVIADVSKVTTAALLPVVLVVDKLLVVVNTLSG